MVKKIALFLTMALLLLAAPLQQIAAQEVVAGTGFSPYSLFGFGDPIRQGTAYNLSMAGIGIGDRNVRYINYLNPAAVTAREARSFMFDFGLENRNVLYQGNAATSVSETATGVLKSASNTFNMHHIVASLPIESHSAFKLGVVPFSTVNYSFRADETSDKLISEVGDIRYTRIGQGGLYQAFLGAGVTLWNRLSLGADLDYYFGEINRYSNAAFTTKSSFRSISSGWTDNVSCFGGKVGMQYQQRLSRTVSATVGATWSFSSKLRGTETRYAYGVSESTDTMVFNKYSLENYRVPSELGVGITLRGADRWMVGFDYTRQDWTGLTFGGYPGVDFEAGVAQNFRAGFEITPNRYDVRHFMRRLTYRAGAYREMSYMRLNGSQVASTGVTLGIGIPVFRYYNSVNVGLDLGQRGTLSNNLVRERYFLVTVSFNLHDIWFIPVLYN